MELIDHGGLPIPEYPETSTNSGLPPATMRSKEARKSRSHALVRKFLGNQQPVGSVVFAKREFIRSIRPCRVSHSTRQRRRSLSAPAAVWYRSSAVLASSFMMIAETGSRNRLKSLAGRHRLSRNVTVHPFHRIGRRERKTPGQHFIKRDTEGVEIAPAIDRAIHTSSLLGRHIGGASRRETREVRPTDVRAEA